MSTAMKQPYAHHLCDALRQASKRIINASKLDDQGFLLRSMLLGFTFWEKPLFVMQEDIITFYDDALIETAKEMQEANCLRLPYPSMLIEVTDSVMIDPSTSETDTIHVYIIHVTQASDTGDIRFTLFTTSTAELGEWIGGFGVGEIPMGERGLALWVPPPDDADRSNGCHEMLSTAGYFLSGLLAVINSPAVERETVTAPKALNRARVSCGAAPIPAFETVRLRLPKTVALPTGGAGDEPTGTGGRGRRTPKPHWRRGHPRRCPSGKVTAIPATIVAWSGEGAPPAPVVQVTVGGNVVALRRD
ncbi:hypothetical protein VH569_33860 [Azospirillum sp. 11R-A]|uniref:hypothetical protein n=1 Tax=Azospirillum sp. 11R-A TaxID=3111634 RepID=UPI003C287034